MNDYQPDELVIRLATSDDIQQIEALDAFNNIGNFIIGKSSDFHSLVTPPRQPAYSLVCYSTWT